VGKNLQYKLDGLGASRSVSLYFANGTLQFSNWLFLSLLTTEIVCVEHYFLLNLVARPAGGAGGQEFYDRRPQHRLEMAEEEPILGGRSLYKRGYVILFVRSLTEETVSLV
jgi:hypothetical protein